jgi:hypothetical protein
MKKIKITFLLIAICAGALGVFQITSLPLYADTLCVGHIGDCPIHMDKCAGTEDCHCTFFDFCVEDEEPPPMP